MNVVTVAPLPSMLAVALVASMLCLGAVVLRSHHRRHRHGPVVLVDLVAERQIDDPSPLRRAGPQTGLGAERLTEQLFAAPKITPQRHRSLS